MATLLSSYPSSTIDLIVEGNIGAGKSTFLEIAQQYLNAHVVFEPHETWRHIGGTENLLEKFYNEPHRWAYTFQTYAFITRIMAQQEALKKNRFPAQILERSIYSDRYCFAQNAFELGFMTGMEWEIYQQWFTWFTAHYAPKPMAFIYLRTSPNVCYERLTKRSRYEEIGVTHEYLQQIHDKHEQWLLKKEGIEKHLYDIPVLVLDCNDEFEKNKYMQEQHLETILSFVSQHFDIQARNSLRSSLPL